jgi:hypothetical protein
MQFLSDPTVVMVAQFLWGILVKKLPALAKWPNQYIPWMNAALGFALKVLGGGGTPAAATHASFTPIALGAASVAALAAPCETWSVLVQQPAYHGYAAAGFFSFLQVPLVAKLVDSVWSAILVGLFHDKFGTPIYDSAPAK